MGELAHGQGRAPAHPQRPRTGEAPAAFDADAQRVRKAVGGALHEKAGCGRIGRFMSNTASTVLEHARAYRVAA